VIYLRPNPKNKQVHYMDSIEHSGLMVHAQHSIAIYTHKGSPNQGPQGIPGDPGIPGEPYLWDTVIASASDEYDPLEVNRVEPATHFRAPYPITAQYVRASLSVPPTGTPVIIDVHMNGLSMFSTLIQIDVGMKTSVGSAIPSVLSITAIPDDAEFTVFITQIGATTTGSGVKVAVTGKKVQLI
jgi:hypothetical protein